MDEQRVDGAWASGTEVDDPLAGVDTTPPPDVEPADLAAYCLMLADDALVLSHRLSEWCSLAPDLEEDIALTNIALDLLGQARPLLARGAAADPAVVPSLPEGSPVPPEDRLAFFRDPHEFRNLTFVELDNGDFAHTVTRVLLFAAARLALYRRLQLSRDPVLAAVAARAGRELAYHRDYAGRWVLTLARGTAESRRRLLAALDELWPRYAELFAPHEVEVTLAAAGVGVDPAHLVPEVASALAPVFGASGVALAELAGLSVAPGPAGRDGAHTDALGLMLARMQVVARAHPMGRW